MDRKDSGKAGQSLARYIPMDLTGGERYRRPEGPEPLCQIYPTHELVRGQQLKSGIIQFLRKAQGISTSSRGTSLRACSEAQGYEALSPCLAGGQGPWLCQVALTAAQ
ncbi:hypothetical protein KIL84_008143 [Mauremys mutica]|uniref:Uncharacterized protein n=1 Tax=Mauremys mutica TaxID=74926 RepID=A0A9D4ALG2_9SAUR|nr:hypothetical protein KIL84_008143 [Mauremys mutica]